MTSTPNTKTQSSKACGDSFHVLSQIGLMMTKCAWVKNARHSNRDEDKIMTNKHKEDKATNGNTETNRETQQTSKMKNKVTKAQ